jgi:hypothetical protein
LYSSDSVVTRELIHSQYTKIVEFCLYSSDCVVTRELIHSLYTKIVEFCLYSSDCICLKSDACVISKLE